MGARETTPPASNPGEPATRTPYPCNPTTSRLFLAPDDRPPLASVKLVRPRRALPGAIGCGRSSWTQTARRHGTGSYQEKPEPQSHPSPSAEVTGPGHHTLLTTLTPIGAGFPCIRRLACIR